MKERDLGKTDFLLCPFLRSEMHFSSKCCEEKNSALWTESQKEQEY